MIGNGGIFGVSKGPGSGVVNKYGVNFDIGTTSTPEAIWAHGGVFPFLDAGIPMDIKSSSALDTIAGTGAQKVRITFNQTDNTEIIQEFDLDGITPVQISDDNKINTRVEVIQTGTGMKNAGEINIVDRATGLIVYQSVEIGESQTLSAVQICPKGKKGLVKKHTVTYAKDQNPLGSADIRFNLRKENGTILVKHATAISAIKDFDIVEYGIGGIEMEEGDIFFCECIAVTVNATPVEARFDIEFEDI